MKQNVRRFKSLRVALKELEPFIRDGSHLKSGKPFSKFGGLRSRELLANWLICVVMTSTGEGVFEFTTDPTGGDGVIIDTTNNRTWLTEHVMVADIDNLRNVPIQDRILEQIGKKIAKGGAAYAGGKTLVVFNDASEGRWYPNRLARALPEPLYFDAVWILGLQAVVDGSYVYGVTSLTTMTGDSPVFLVTLAPEFDDWTVNRVQ